MAEKADAGLFERFGRTFAAGDVVFNEGDPGAEMFVIQAGIVQLSRRMRGRDAHLATLLAGDFFGEMAVINNRPRSATATIIEEARLLVIDGRTFEAMVRGNAEIALRLIKKLAARVEAANSQVEALLVRDLNHRIVAYLRQLADERGQVEDSSVRIDVTSEEIAVELNAEASEVDACLERLSQAKLVALSEGSVLIAAVGKLDQFLEFLDMKEKYGGR